MKPTNQKAYFKVQLSSHCNSYRLMAIIQLRKCSQGIWKVCIRCIWFILQEPINDNCFEYLRCQTSKKRHRQTLIFEKKHGKPTAGYQGGHHREQVCNQRKICQQMVFFLKWSFGSITSNYRCYEDAGQISRSPRTLIKVSFVVRKLITYSDT